MITVKNVSILLSTSSENGRNLREPTVGSADSDVQDEVELLVKWCIASLGVRVVPRVWQKSAILSLLSKVANIIKGLVFVESNKEDLVHAAVYVEVDVVWGPLHTEGVVALGVVLTADLLGIGGLPESIRVRSRA